MPQHELLGPEVCSLLLILCPTFVPPVNAHGQSRSQFPFVRVHKSQIKENGFVVMKDSLQGSMTKSSWCYSKYQKAKGMTSRSVYLEGFCMNIC